MHSIRRTELEVVFSTWTPERGTTVVSVRGDCDLTAAGQLEADVWMAVEGGATRIVVDLRETTLMDSSGLHALLAGRERAAGCGKELLIVCDRPSILQVLELTGIDSLIPVHPTLEHATGLWHPVAY